MEAYDKLAEELRDKVNIVAVDCDAHRPLCTKNEVRGFPTIKMYVLFRLALTIGLSTGNPSSIPARDHSTSSRRLL
jgi:hypothetical protein